jgi:uncharacterized membrane protein
MWRGSGALALFSRVRSTYWFMPSVITAAALLLAFILVHLDRVLPANDGWLGWTYGGGADGALSLLSSITTATITVVSVTFSVMVVALTVSSQHFGPRLLNSFMCDSGSQVVLGAFTGTFAYCLIVLRTVHGNQLDGAPAFVPHVAVTGAVALTLLSVGMLIYYVHHVAVSMQVAVITANVARDLERAIDRLYPERLGEGDHTRTDEDVPPAPDAAFAVAANSSGYLQSVDADRLLRVAGEGDTVVWLAIRPGDFVVEGAPIASVSPAPRDPHRFSAALNRACVLGGERTSHQDPAFVIQQLVEIALRGLSPGVNEPFTAGTCVDRLGQGLCRLAARKMPGPARFDNRGNLRVVARGWTFDELLSLAFDPIALYAGRSATVRLRVFEALGRLLGFVRRDSDRRAIGRIAESLIASADGVDNEHQHAAVTEAYAAVRRALDLAAPFSSG